MRTDGRGHRSLGELHLFVAGLLRAVFTRAAAAEGLTFAEAQTIRLLSTNAAQVEIIDILGADPSRVSAIMRRLAGRGLIVRTWGRGDRRLRVIELTDQGTAAVGRIGAYLESQSPIMQRLDESERCTFSTLLSKLAGFDVA